MLADAEDAEDRSAAQRATTEQSQDMCDFDEEVAIEGEPAMVSFISVQRDRGDLIQSGRTFLRILRIFIFC